MAIGWENMDLVLIYLHEKTQLSFSMIISLMESRAGRTEIDDLSLKTRRNQIGWTVTQTCERVSTQVHQMW